MQRRSGRAVVLAAAIASMVATSWAQQPVVQPVSPQPPSAQAVQPPQPPTMPAQPPQPLEEGFFRPADDAALTRVPDPVQVPAGARDGSAVPLLIDAQTFESLQRAREAEQRAREAAERDLDRAAREHREAQANAAVSRPIVISPLEGTAPITSPLDGSAPILSPIGR